MKKELTKLGWGVRANKFSESVTNKIVTYRITPEMYQEALKDMGTFEGTMYVTFDIEAEPNSLVEFWMYESEVAKAERVNPICHESYDHEEKCVDYDFEYSLTDYTLKEKIELFDQYLNIAQ